MNKLILLVVVIFMCTCVSLAQKGTAEPDYYPMNYSGDTWTGDVTAVNEDTREFTLIYRKNDKEQSFVGVLPKRYTVKMKDGSDHEVKMSELIGMRLKVYYMTKSKKVNDQKVKTNEVFKIKFLPPNK
jgi:hypothetical protein